MRIIIQDAKDQYGGLGGKQGEACQRRTQGRLRYDHGLRSQARRAQADQARPTGEEGGEVVTELTDVEKLLCELPLGATVLYHPDDSQHPTIVQLQDRCSRTPFPPYFICFGLSVERGKVEWWCDGKGGITALEVPTA